MCEECLYELIRYQILANWMVTLATCFAACTALYITMIMRFSHLLVTFKSLEHNTTDESDLFIILVCNKGCQPAYILGCGFATICITTLFNQESRHPKVESINPTLCGTMRIQLPKNLMKEISKAASRHVILKHFLRHPALRKKMTYIIAKYTRAYVITGDSKKHYLKRLPQDVIIAFQKELLLYLDNNNSAR